MAMNIARAGSPTIRRGGEEFIADIERDQLLPVTDVQDTIRVASARAHRDPAAEEAFIRARLQLARSIEGPQRPSDNELRVLAGRLPVGSAAVGPSAVGPTAIASGTAPLRSSIPPFPGGVGYGVFYDDAFRKAFATGTALAVDIITPKTVGGNNADWLYLTACNRAAKGVEAFVSYHAQEDARFKVYDWARDDPWQVDIDYSVLKSYIADKSMHGENLPVIGIQNHTYEVGKDIWRNAVYLYNQAAQRYDRIYQHDYTATADQQANGWVGSWGPIVETFEDSYRNTNTLGFFRTYLQACDPWNAWSPWALLDASGSSVRNDQKGFRLKFLDPNHTFAVS